MAENQARQKFTWLLKVIKLCFQISVNKKKVVVLRLNFYGLKKAEETSNKFNKLEQ